MDITYKWLDNDAISALDPIMFARNLPALNRATTRVRAAYDGDTLVGFLVLQLMPHLEPLYVDRAYRGEGDARCGIIANQLIGDMLTFVGACGIRGFICIADNPIVERMCVDYGLMQITSPVFIKL
jgi:hypothetical protein